MAEQKETDASGLPNWLNGPMSWLLGAVLAVAVVALDLYLTREQLSSEAPYPNRRITVVVPFTQGGGSDGFARIIKRGIETNDLLPVPIVIQNVPGAGATIGSRRVRDKEPDGYTVLLLHEAIITAKYAGSAAYGPEAFEPVAGTSRMGLVIAVKKDSKIENLNQLMELAEGEGAIQFAANQHTPSHFAGLLLEKEYARIKGAPAGETPAKFVFSFFGGGSERYTAIIGGHATATAFSFQEYWGFKDDIKGLAIFTPEPHPDAPEMQSSYQQGFEISSVNMQFWWMPKGTPQDRIDVFANAIRGAIESDYVQGKLIELKTEPVFVRGDELQHEIQIREEAIKRVDLRSTVQLPDIPTYVLVVTLLLAVAIVVQNVRGHSAKKSSDDLTESRWADAPKSQVAISIVGFVLIVIYACLLGLESVDFRVATSLFLIGIGMLLSKWQPKYLPSVISLALIVSFSIHLLFERLFVVELP